MKILVINAGSSSLKYQLMDPDSGRVYAKGLCERIGLDGRLNHKVIDENGESVLKETRDIPMPTHSEAIESVLSILVDEKFGVVKSLDEVDAVGHRVLLLPGSPGKARDDQRRDHRLLDGRQSSRGRLCHRHCP